MPSALARRGTICRALSFLSLPMPWLCSWGDVRPQISSDEPGEMSYICSGDNKVGIGDTHVKGLGGNDHIGVKLLGIGGRDARVARSGPQIGSEPKSAVR